MTPIDQNQIPWYQEMVDQYVEMIYTYVLDKEARDEILENLLEEIQKKLTKSKKLWVLERFFPDTTEGRIIIDYYIYDPKSEDPDYSESNHALENLWPLTIPSDNGEWQESGFMGSGKFGEWYYVRRWEP